MVMADRPKALLRPFLLLFLLPLLPTGVGGLAGYLGLPFIGRLFGAGLFTFTSSLFSLAYGCRIFLFGHMAIVP
jgi:hypothetical protein